MKKPSQRFAVHFIFTVSVVNFWFDCFQELFALNVFPFASLFLKLLIISNALYLYELWKRFRYFVEAFTIHSVPFGYDYTGFAFHLFVELQEVCRYGHWKFICSLKFASIIVSYNDNIPPLVVDYFSNVFLLSGKRTHKSWNGSRFSNSRVSYNFYGFHIKFIS